jgi:hypothetical protein
VPSWTARRRWVRTVSERWRQHRSVCDSPSRRGDLELGPGFGRDRDPDALSVLPAKVIRQSCCQAHQLGV